jgi:hypothetical protein
MGFWFYFQRKVLEATGKNICSLQVYHKSSSNEIWRGHEGFLFIFDCTINISNYYKPELAMNALAVDS